MKREIFSFDLQIKARGLPLIVTSGAAESVRGSEP